VSIWTDASATIDAAFADPELINYTGAGLAGVDIAAIRSDLPGPEFSGAGNTLKQVIYEIAYALLPQEPEANVDTFTHRGRAWMVINVDRFEPASKWQLTVTDNGPA